jgi:hypothetical protein
MMTPDEVTKSNNQALATAVAAVSGAGGEEKPAGESKVIENSEAGSKTSVHSKVIQPINDLSDRGNRLQELLAQEEAQTTTNTAKAKAIEAVVNQVKAEDKTQDQAVITGTETIQPNDPTQKVPTV